jgi:glucose-1-phosphate thymidylyltransferase
MISCPEEIAFRMGFIDMEQLLKLGQELSGNSYGKYILDLANTAR